MKEERMKILKMVEDGKIGVDEAAKLMDALKETYPFEFYCHDDGDFTDRVKQFSKDAEGFMKNVAGKMGDLCKEMEPKVRNVTKTVVEKTAKIVDELGKALSDCLSSLNTGCREEDGCCTESQCAESQCAESQCAGNGCAGNDNGVENAGNFSNDGGEENREN